jgi:hypothetical protein
MPNVSLYFPSATKALPYIESAQGVRLTAEGILETVAGSTVWHKAGSREETVSVSQDGTVAVSQAGVLLGTGEWWLEGDTYCQVFARLDPGATCYQLVLDGSTLQAFDLNGVLQAEFECARGQGAEAR